MFALVNAFMLGYTRMILRRAVKAGVISEVSEGFLFASMHNSFHFLSDLMTFQSLLDKGIILLPQPTRGISSTDK